MPRPATSIDSETLQADVMRFMAIIAFCLIAILALVRNIDETAVPVPEATPVADVTPEPTPAPVNVPIPEPVPVPVIESPPEPDVLPQAQPVTATVARTVVMEEPEVEPVPLPVPDTAPEAEAEPLSLGFASETVFLSLIREGEVRLLAKRDDGYVHLGA